MIEEVSKCGAERQFRRLFGDAGQFAHTTEKEHVDTEISRDLGHRKIVT